MRAETRKHPYDATCASPTEGEALSEQWFIYFQGDVSGPFTLTEMGTFARDGRLQPQSQATRRARPDWKAASGDQLLKELFVSARTQRSPEAAKEKKDPARLVVNLLPPSAPWDPTTDPAPQPVWDRPKAPTVRLESPKVRSNIAPSWAPLSSTPAHEKRHTALSTVPVGASAPTLFWNKFFNYNEFNDNRANMGRAEPDVERDVDDQDPEPLGV